MFFLRGRAFYSVPVTTHFQGANIFFTRVVPSKEVGSFLQGVVPYLTKVVTKDVMV